MENFIWSKIQKIKFKFTNKFAFTKITENICKLFLSCILKRFLGRSFIKASEKLSCNEIRVKVFS